MIQLVEKLSRIINFVMMKLGVPLFIIPKAIISYFMFFTTDAGRDAFELPFEMWQVFTSLIYF